MTIQQVFVEKAIEVIEQLGLIDTLLKANRPKSKDDVNFGHIGDLNHVLSQLEEIIDFLSPKPDYSEWSLNQILDDVKARGLDIEWLTVEEVEQYADEYRSAPWLCRELRKLDSNAKHPVKPSKKGKARFQQPKGRTAEAIVKGMI